MINYIYKRSITFVLIILIYFISACQEARDNKNHSPSTKVDNKQTDLGDTLSSNIAKVELAPFDRFPNDDKFPLVFRFEGAVAPANRASPQNFEKLSLKPSRPGTWQWDSDSELQFVPLDPWKPKELIEVSLDGLLTSDGSIKSGPKPQPSNFKIALPSLTVAFSKCELSIEHRTPLIQVPQIGLRFNYMASTHPKDFWELKLKRGDLEEKLDLSSPGWSDKAMAVTAEGPKIFRPESPASIIFRLKGGYPVGLGSVLDKGVECSIPIDPQTWDALAEKKDQVAEERPLTEIVVTAPVRSIEGSAASREPLYIKMRAPWSTRSVSHGKAKGLTIDSGIRFIPEIIGEWKTDLYDESTLVFIPKNDWPVGIETKLVVDPNIFPAVQLRTSEVIFTTPALSARFSNASLYTDPQDPARRSVVATLEFSHAPKAGEIERLLSASMRVEPKKVFDQKIDFTVTPDEKSPRKLHVRTDELELPNEPAEIRFWLSKGVTTAMEGAPSNSDYSITVNVPSKREIFKITSSNVSIVKRADERLERVLSIEVSEPITQDVLASALQLYLLPDCEEEKYEKLCKDQESFGDQARVLPEVLAESDKITLTTLPRDEVSSPNLFHFSFEAPGKRELFLDLKRGLQSSTSFTLAKDFRVVYFLDEFERSLKIMHQGALLSLSGDRKLGIALRNVPDVKFELSRILPRDVHHLVSATYGNFSQPEFSYSDLGIDQFAERFSYSARFPDREPGQTVYATVDFNRFMSNGDSPKGLFVLSAIEKKDKKALAGEQQELKECSSQEGGYEEEGGCEIEQPLEDNRLVLLTDLGMLVKDQLSGGHDVFVMSFRSGEPVAGATVKLLGQNGVALFTEVTKADGRVSFPPTKELKREQVPLVYVVEKGDDYSFIPFQRSDRQLNFSRFDVGGVVNSEEAEGLRALIFTDRGIYRPGEEARFGIMVRRRNLELAGMKLPLEISITDPRGIEILNKKFISSKLGFDDYRWSSENALTGTYSFSIYLARKDQSDEKALLGSTSFRVDEFQPDKLNVKTRYLDMSDNIPIGWAPLKGRFEVNVQNLFGTPAVDNKVSGTLLIRPWDGMFKEFPAFRFYKSRKDSELPQQAESLGELKTDLHGLVKFTPDLARFSESAFRLEFAAEAFEKESGRSVVSGVGTLVSDAKSFIGWKADGSLDYVNKGSPRKISLISVGVDLKGINRDDLKLELEETRYLSALVKQPNGTLTYEQTPKKSVVSTEKLAIASEGNELMLKTDSAGSFNLRILDENNQELNSIPYVVHGEGNTTFVADRVAEVGIRLSKSSVLPGEELEISLNTPYAGAGIITIERDKVYSSKWFRSETLSSVQKITVPKDIIGNAYISVAFVRSLNSKDIYASPLSYGVEPFTIAKSHYTEGIKILAPEKVIPGSTLTVNYTLDGQAKFLLYAVDEGILQFAKYKNPQPVESFVPKRALEVDTYQILDLILPDHRIVEELSSPGGDEDINLGKFKNPFARKRRAPMAFWSGIIADDKKEGKIEIPVPEYFNGTIRLIAVAASERKVGIETTKSIAQHDFVIDPQVPYFVSPGDEFEVGATVANTVKGSGKDVKLKIDLAPSIGLDLVDQKELELVVPEGEDRAFRVKLRAKDTLGEQEIRFKADGIGRQAAASDSISIRPPHQFRTSLQAGIYRPDKDGLNSEKKLILARELYGEKRDVRASISESPLTVGRALVNYLKEYPYGCTEQLVSSAFPAVLFGADAQIGLSESDVNKFTMRAFEALSSRQRADGSFGLWDASSVPDILFSVYAVHFLMEAKEHQLEVPEVVLERAMKWVKDIGIEPTYDHYSQLAQSYALYVRARSGQVVSKEAKAIVSDLDRQWGKSWRDTTIALFLAGTFKIMQMDAEAEQLLKRAPEIWKVNMAWPLNDPALYGAVYSWISAKHFAQDKMLSPLDTVVPVERMISEGSFYSFNSSFSVMGLQALNEKLGDLSQEALKISYSSAPPAFLPLDLTGKVIRFGLLPEGSKEVVYNGRNNTIFFYELSESGFDKIDPKPFQSGLSISRELKNEKGEAQTLFQLSDKLEVTLFIKADQPISRMALLELVPGGFEIDLSDEGLANRKSLHPDANSWNPSFIDIQEDRIIFFGDLPKDTATFTYRLKPLSRGRYTFGAPYAEGMYDTTKRFLGSPTQIEVK